MPEPKRCSCCEKHTLRAQEEKKKLLNRLRRIEGQVRGLQAMVEADAYCNDVLTQSAAVNAAINAFNRELLAEHLRDELAAGKDFDAICAEMLRYHEHTHLLFSLESLANLARNGRVKPAVAAVARVLGIRVIGQASAAGELAVICKTRGEHGALERIVLELKEHGYAGGRVIVSHCGNPAAAERLKHMIEAVFEGAQVVVNPCGGLCSYYAELGGLLVGYEDAEA